MYEKGAVKNELGIVSIFFLLSKKLKGSMRKTIKECLKRRFC